MKLKNYYFRFAIGLTAFFISVIAFYGYKSLYFQEQNIMTVNLAIEPAKNLSKTELTLEPELKFDAFGNYHLADKPDKGFEDFDCITIFTHNWEIKHNPDSVREIPIPPEGYVETSITYGDSKKGYVEEGESYKITYLSIGNGLMSLSTETIKGNSYQFNGRFLVKSSFESLPNKTRVLEGQLTKIRKGKKIAESNAQFIWYEGF